MYFWQVISCNLFLNKNVKIAGKNCKIRKTFWCTVKVQWLTTSICWLSKGQWKYRGKWDAGKTCTFGSRNICSVQLLNKNYHIDIFVHKIHKYLDHQYDFLNHPPLLNTKLLSHQDNYFFLCICYTQFFHKWMEIYKVYADQDHLL